MKKLIALGFLSMFTASQAHAGFMNTVTGADMAGIQVTAEFSDGSSESLSWSVINAGTGVVMPDPIDETINLENEVGGVNGRLFSLTQQGDSQGNTDGKGNYYGLWTLTNNAQALLTSLVIDVLNTDVVFDAVWDDNGDGSDRGRAFTVAPFFVSSTDGSYDDMIQDQLFGKLTLDLNLDLGEKLDFMADTDLITSDVPAPAALSLMLLGLAGLVARRKMA